MGTNELSREAPVSEHGQIRGLRFSYLALGVRLHGV